MLIIRLFKNSAVQSFVCQELFLSKFWQEDINVSLTANQMIISIIHEFINFDYKIIEMFSGSLRVTQSKPPHICNTNLKYFGEN